MQRKITSDDIRIGNTVVYKGDRSFNGIFCNKICTIENIIISGSSKYITLECICGDKTIKIEENEITLLEDYYIIKTDNIIQVKEDNNDSNISLLEKQFKRSLWKNGMKKRR